MECEIKFPVEVRYYVYQYRFDFFILTIATANVCSNPLMGSDPLIKMGLRLFWRIQDFPNAKLMMFSNRTNFNVWIINIYSQTIIFPFFETMFKPSIYLYSIFCHAATCT